MTEDVSAGLGALNRLGDQELGRRFAACCGSARWVASMVSRRPFRDPEGLQAEAADAAEELSREDWLEAFSHHPRIGDLESLRRRFGSQSGGWSEGEQAGLAGTPEEVLERLAAGNQQYEERFGFIFLVCASGKSAAEMLSLLENRLINDEHEEFAIAAGEQRKITALRLAKLIDEA